MQLPKNIPIRVGFDLDGVLLYNPARIFRPITIAAKHIFGNFSKTKKAVHFYYPVSQPEKMLWRIVHWSSLFIAPGIEDIAKLVNDQKIRAFIVTSRYDCLKEDFQDWLKKLNKDAIFEACYHNKNDLQPHIFKEKKIHELQLDYFVEDNYDIVSHISENTKAQGIWISNYFDRGIPYKPKFMSLKEALRYINDKVTNSKK